MECQACVFDGIPEALATLTKTHTVGIAHSELSGKIPESQMNSTTPITKELNPIETKIARELSKKKPKKEVILALRSANATFKKIVALANEQLALINQIAKLEPFVSDEDAADLAHSIALDYHNAVESLRPSRIKIHELIDNRSDSVKRKIPALAALLPKHQQIVDLIKEVQPKLQKVCLGCSKASNDDNLSRYGQIFISIDAMTSLGLVASGADPSQDLDDRSDPTDAYNGDSAPDDKEDSDAFLSASDHGDSFRDSSDNVRVAQTAHDYLLSHTAPDVHVQDPESCSHLPAHIEDLLRKHLAAFNELDVFEKLLCFSQWSGQSFSDFGTMKWTPKEIRKPQSKQFVTQRWNKVVEKFPLAAALRKGKVCRSLNSELAKHFAEEAYEELTLNLDSSLDFKANSDHKSGRSQVVDLFS